MKDELFDELIASVREGGKILHGKAKSARAFIVEIPNIRKTRLDYKHLQGRQKKSKTHKSRQG